MGGQKWMQTAEIKNGRLAMLAISGFCFQEVVTHIAVVDQTPIFFKPILSVLNENVPGYVIPEDVVKDAATSATSTLDSVTGTTAESITVTPPVVDTIPPAVDTIPPVDTTPPVVDTIPPVNGNSGSTTDALPVALPFFDDFSAAPAKTPVETIPPVDTIPPVNTIPPVDTIPPVNANSGTVSAEEYAAAKKQIAEL